MQEAEMSIRLDKWLWAARFFKTRSLAADAVDGGKVRINDARAKPSRNVRLGDELRITRGESEHVIHVTALSKRRGPASTAQALYQETAASQATRAAERSTREFIPHPPMRPDKRARRQIHRFIRGG